MKGNVSDRLNKLNIPIEETDDYPSVLWVTGADERLRDTLTFRDHSHTYFELHVITAGSVTYGFGSREVCVLAGEFIVAPPCSSHRVVVCDESFCKITVAFTLPPECTLYKQLLSIIPKPFKVSAEIEENIDFLLKCAERRSEYYAKIIKARLSETVYLACEVMNATWRGNASFKCDPRVYRAKKYIDDNPHIFFGCEEVAAFCRVSSKQLGRLFRRSDGIGLLEYIHQKKLECAKHLLEDKNLSERQISELLGFSGAEYFSRFFFRLEGKLPSEYRREL